MAGNSQRRGRRTTPKPGAPFGSGGKRRASLRGKGPTPPADQRLWHKAYSGTEPVPRRTAWKQEKERRAAEAAGRAPKVGTPGTSPPPAAAAGARGAGRRGGSGGRSRDGLELLVGRNPVVEALRAQVPATALYVASGIDVDDRVTELVRAAADRSIAIMEVSRAELDRLTGGLPHQGVGLQVPPFAYLPFEDLLAAAVEHPAPPLLVALDGVTDPRNLGAVIRSAAAFGAHGVFLPERRAAGVTAAAWRTSAGAAARLPVARVTNLTRSLKACQQAGLVVVGLDADGETELDDLEVAVGPLVLVVGSEGRGLSRLVGTTCDLRMTIPTEAAVDSLNASVAAAVALAEVSRRRRGAR
ncbi:MAG: 23S rRNA (guanosine(2251)-2'-O)-methyltransferase RlmB [Micromonosporaceae bacterium]|nr:23S rRNA (guanosine(2251)-2'-O)-methyltransferase RlmB [Micromonosporaceae bacterium]